MQIEEAKDILANCIADYVIGDYCVGKYCPMEDECKDKDCPFQIAIDTVLEELENKQDDINILQAQRDSMEYQFKQAKAELEKKDKVINEMAKHIHLSGDYECLNKECEDDGDISCEDCIKEYFYKKVKETKDNGSTRNI